MSAIQPFDAPIYVTRPFLPPLAEFAHGLGEIWQNKWLTNKGPIVEKFRIALSHYVKTGDVCLFNNGTLALQIGLQGMGISGEVITTPFTFAATTHALYWNKIRPVFCDIDPHNYTIDADKIEALITPWTSAILAVHVFGHPCDLDSLAAIARNHNLKLIYDAAHAFGVAVDGKPIADFGDLSMFSFHATKLFHSIEGGMLTVRDLGLIAVFDYLKNFGFKNEVEVVMPGTNAKMNEMQALMGLQVLSYIDDIIEKKQQIFLTYKDRLADVPGIKFYSDIPPHIKYNYGYVPIEVNEAEFGCSRDALYEKLKHFNIFTRRYFYPLIPDLACYQNLPVGDPLTTARRVAENILILPTYYDLDLDHVHTIADIIQHIQKRD